MTLRGFPLRGSPEFVDLIRFLVGSFLILFLLAGYCLNPSHQWREGIGALPVEHIQWLPASAFYSGSIDSLGLTVLLLVTAGVVLHVSNRWRTFLMMTVVGVAAITSLAVIGQRLSPRPVPVFDLTGFFPYENHFAAFANLVFPVALAAGARQRLRAFEEGKVSSPSGLLFCAAGLMAVAVALSGSRAGFLISCLIIVAFILIQMRLARSHPQVMPPLPGWSRFMIAAGVSVAMVGGVILFCIHFSQISGELHFRGRVLVDALKMWKDNPVWGTGSGTFAAIFPYYQSLPVEEYSFLHAHCEPIQFLAEYGILGGSIVLVGGFSLFCFRRSEGDAKGRPPVFREIEGLCLELALTGVGLHSLIDFPFRHPLNALLTVVWIAILVSHGEGLNFRRQRKQYG